jgi:TonB family protein
VPKIQLEITGPDGSVQEAVLTQDVAILGSGPRATFCLSDSRVSSAHVLLKAGKDGTLTLLDLGSETGTRLRGQLVNQPVALASGDLLQVGSTQIRVRFDDTEATDKIPVLPPTANVEPADTVRARALERRGAFDPQLRPGERAQLEVSLFWGAALLEVRTFAAGGSVRVGPGPDSDFPLEGAGFDRPIELVSSSGAVQPPPGAELRIRHGDEETAARSLLKLGHDDRCRVIFGSTSLHLRWVNPAAPLRAGPFDDLDFGFAKLLSVGGLLHAMVLIGFLVTPITSEQLTEQLFSNPGDLRKIIARPIKPPVMKFPVLPPARAGDKPRGPPGRFGLRTAHQVEAAPSKPGAPIVDPKRREVDRHKVLSTGLLAAFGDNASTASDVLGPGGLGSGINDALGGLRPGAGMGVMNGIGGLGPRGTGPGGDGHAVNIGGMGTRGPGRGGGGPDLGLGGPGKDPVHIIQEKRGIGVALDKSVIAKVIRRHWNEIKYCYETGLNQDPHLAGKVAVAFTINGTGAVSAADVSESSLGNRKVEECMTTDIKRWRFPEPRGGGQVFVTYPWVFKAAGEEE